MFVTRDVINVPSRPAKASGGTLSRSPLAAPGRARSEATDFAARRRNNVVRNYGYATDAADAARSPIHWSPSRGPPLTTSE
jgi:hypothetical protein